MGLLKKIKSIFKKEEVATAIPDQTDINDIKTTGDYYVGVDLSNSPSSELAVLHSGEVILPKTQIELSEDVNIRIKQISESIRQSSNAIGNALKSIVLKVPVNKEYKRLKYLHNRTKNRRIKKKLKKRMDKVNIK